VKVGKNMLPQYFTEQDWKLFKSRLTVWQETYISKLNAEYITLLSGNAAPSEKYWALEKRMKEDENKFLLPLRMSRSNFITNLLSLLHNGVIEISDLAEFSDELKSTIDMAYNH